MEGELFTLQYRELEAFVMPGVPTKSLMYSRLAGRFIAVRRRRLAIAERLRVYIHDIQRLSLPVPVLI